MAAQKSTVTPNTQSVTLRLKLLRAEQVISRLEDESTRSEAQYTELRHDYERLVSGIDGLWYWLQVASKRTDGGQHIHARAVMEEMDSMDIAPTTPIVPPVALPG